jgi:hypothetical protein
MLEPPVISHVARDQLAAWEELARGWATVAMKDPGTEVRVQRCASCWVGIWRITDEYAKPYRYTDEQKLALVVAHLRQAHMHLDPDRG